MKKKGVKNFQAQLYSYFSRCYEVVLINEVCDKNQSISLLSNNMVENSSKRAFWITHP